MDKDKLSRGVEVENYSSATNTKMRAQTEAQIVSELENGHYKIVDDKPLIVSAIGAIPKRDSSKVRLIHDCSPRQDLPSMTLQIQTISSTSQSRMQLNKLKNNK